ncbi:MAG: class I SAM-dependent methyltransferase [Chloroflexi bacterium]|nr:class I SAM-dependent methyltransferase [Chloroflexota bacterium]MBV9133583.1 class I SAM-dependent methyltransferase [Chloroflexota bacterium]
MPNPADPDTNAAIWKSADVARTFAAEAGQREGRRREQLQLMARLLPFDGADEFTFVDLGAGTGAASRALLDEYPHANAVLAEYSPQMAAEGERLLVPYAGRYRYVEFDMLAGDWAPLDGVRFDAAVSSLSIHHLPDSRKQSLFSELFARLEPGGWYVNFDPVRAPDDVLESVWQRVNDRYEPDAAHKRTHRDAREQARYENHVRYMQPLEPQLKWLQEAGFAAVDVYWKRLDYVIFGGFKPR